MNNVRALTRNQVVDIGWNGDAVIHDLRAKNRYNIRGSVARGYNHSDWMPRTKADADMILRNAGGRWNWTARPVVLEIKGNFIAAAIHSFPHSVVVASNAFSVAQPPVTRANERDANGNWRIGSHFCLHYTDSLALRPNGANSFYTSMNAAVREAVRLAGGTWDSTNPVLSQGSRGEEVRELQTLLNRHGANPQLNIDGSFGPLTRAAVDNFQRTNGLQVNGNVDRAMWDRLRGAVSGTTVTTPPTAPIQPQPQPPSSPNLSPILSRGNRGEEVIEAQIRLNIHGANPRLAEDGSFGPLTQAAVEAFQRRVGIAVTGTVNAVTWERLRKDITIPRNPTIQRGSRGNDVMEAQILLNQRGANPRLAVDGSFGPLTEQAVISFQRRMEVTDNGIIVADTWNRLRQQDNSTITQGASGVRVGEAQLLLNRHGALPALVVDGRFGPLTRAAVDSFQTRHNIQNTGTIDSATWARLRG
jgi:peptidoglycan hydrolase-like protein with peptidoglycan-binding domain